VVIEAVVPGSEVPLAPFTIKTAPALAGVVVATATVMAAHVRMFLKRILLSPATGKPQKTLNATAPMSRLVNILLTQYGFAKNSGKYPWHRVRSYRLARL
jgi:hypothetical protein